MCYLIIIEFIIVTRSCVYWFMMYEESLFNFPVRRFRISIYLTEIVVGGIIIFISYKNLQSEENNSTVQTATNDSSISSRGSFIVHK